MIRKMRRKERQLSDEQTLKILKTQTWGVLSVYGDDGYPYSVPVNYGYIDGKIYIHSTSAESHKMDAIRRNAKVCLTVVSEHNLDAPNYATHYCSVIVFGASQIISRAEEKTTAMIKMMQRLAPEMVGKALAHCGNTSKAFTIIEITPEYITGKSGQ